jgi:dGTPase
MTIREQTEQLELALLSPRAAKAAQSRGRERAEQRCPLRTDFQRDRDRIIHCKSFRRLTYKTQVFIAPELDHYRTRLTHTLEVAQIARTIARALRLNEDLTEAIALGHDLGHTPFGHAGEETLDQVYRSFDPEARFNHAAQSLRVVEVLENEGRGLNLTWETRDGIAKHSKGQEDLPRGEMQRDADRPATMEGKVVMFADRIAYVNHDIDDALRAGLISMADLPSRALAVLGASHSQRITTMVFDLVNRTGQSDQVAMSDEVLAATDDLKDFLFARVYGGAGALEGPEKVAEVVGNLFRYYMEHPEELPNGAVLDESQTDLARRVCDYVAGMTDRYAKQQFIAHFLPDDWRAA